MGWVCVCYALHTSPSLVFSSLLRRGPSCSLPIEIIPSFLITSTTPCDRWTVTSRLSRLMPWQHQIESETRGEMRMLRKRWA